MLYKFHVVLLKQLLNNVSKKNTEGNADIRRTTYSMTDLHP